MRGKCLVGVLLLGAVAAWPQAPPRTFTNSIGMKFVPIEPGTFMMGSDGGSPDERPAHKVALTQGFYMQATEVTQRQWQAVMGNTPSRFKGPDLPVEQVSWGDAQEFLKKLNGKEKGARYRLPTEAEWEYSARAGQPGKPANLDAVAWYSENSGGRTHPVGQKQPNAWGLYDMLGNVWEWCADWFADDYYATSPSVDPPGPATGSARVLRGAFFEYPASGVRAAFRFSLVSGGWGSGVGFRCVRELLSGVEEIVTPLSTVGSGQTTLGGQGGRREAGRPSGSVTNSIGMKFVPIEPGTFMMGSDSGAANETPVHKVTLTEGFYMQATEVTQAQWQAVMGNNPSNLRGPDLPVEEVSWGDAQEFLKKLNGKEKGVRYRLPTEAEWEYAARAGQPGEPANLDAVAWYDKNSGNQTHPVGQKQPNGWGLYDMLGNVSEWCADWHDSEYYGKSPSVDPRGPAKGTIRVQRGGSWYNDPRNARVSVRFWLQPDGRDNVLGFRCVRELFP